MLLFLYSGIDIIKLGLEYLLLTEICTIYYSTILDSSIGTSCLLFF